MVSAAGTVPAPNRSWSFIADIITVIITTRRKYNGLGSEAIRSVTI
jgi:hypothetical protein